MIAALAITVIFAALAIDVGRLALESRKLQTIADLSALAAVEEAGWCSGVTAPQQATFQSSAQASAARNGYAGNLVTENGVVTGTVSTVSAMRVFTAGSDLADINAVEVTARRTVPSSLVAGGWLGGTTELQRRAVAYDAVAGSMSIGSFLLSVRSEDSPVLNSVIGGLLGGSVGLDAVSYQGLADARVSLGALANAAGPGGVGLSAGTVDSFLKTQLTAGEMLQVIASALTAGHTATADINTLISATGNVNVITVGDLLRVSADNPESAADVALNVFSLVSGTAQLANKDHTVTVPTALNLPLGLGNVTVLLHIIEGPRFVIGPPGVDSNGAWKTRAQTAQVRMDVKVALTGGLPVLGGLVAVGGDLMLYSEVAPASAWLQTIRCADAASLAHVARIGVRTGVGQMGIGRFADISKPSGAIVASPALSVNVAAGLVALSANVAATTQVVAAQDAVLEYTVNNANPLPQIATADTSLDDALSTATSSLAGSLDVTVSGGGGLVGFLLGTVGLSIPAIVTGLVSELLAPLLNTLDVALFEPLFRSLGIHFGGADVMLHAIQQGTPRLAE